MSLNGDYWCSTIVCFTSEDLEGPWVYQGPVICGGFSGKFGHNGYATADDWKNTDLAIATECTSLPAHYATPGDAYGAHWGEYWPNCIDPCVFYDDDDNLWMSYGSWSGGIFMIRLDKTNGLRDYTYTFPYQISGKTVTLTQKTDPTVLAGLKVELEGRQLDGTVKSRLDDLSRKLNELIV